MNREKKIITFIIVFFVVLSSYYFVTTTFSKARSTVVGSGETDVAKWELLIDDHEESIDLIPGGDSVTYTLRLTSNSEVAGAYSIRISNLPDSVRVSLDNGSYETPSNGVIEFSDCGSFTSSVTSVINDHTLSFKAISGASNVSNRELNIDVVAVQDDI